MSAPQAIRNPRNKSGQRIIHANLQAATELKAQGIPLRLQWIPGHYDDRRNDVADKMARMAVGSNRMHPFCRLVSNERASIRKQILKEWEHPKREVTFGGSTQSCLPSAPDDYTARCHGTEPTYLPS
jgi:hypothetical protein